MRACVCARLHHTNSRVCMRVCARAHTSYKQERVYAHVCSRAYIIQTGARICACVRARIHHTNRCTVGGGIATKILVMILDVKAETEEDIVPQEHLHFRILARIDGHDVTFDYSNCSSCCSYHKVRVYLGAIVG